jgi:hypothetical protein
VSDTSTGLLIIPNRETSRLSSVDPAQPTIGTFSFQHVPPPADLHRLIRYLCDHEGFEAKGARLKSVNYRGVEEELTSSSLLEFNLRSSSELRNPLYLIVPRSHLTEAVLSQRLKFNAIPFSGRIMSQAGYSTIRDEIHDCYKSQRTSKHLCVKAQVPIPIQTHHET